MSEDIKLLNLVFDFRNPMTHRAVNMKLNTVNITVLKKIN